MFQPHSVLYQNEVETITQAAYQDTAQFYGMTQDELMNAVNQDHPSYNKEIADTFNNTFNRLFQSYREANDSQDGTGVSGKVGEGQESQQAQPQQGGGTQEAGGSGVFQAPGQEITPGAPAQTAPAQQQTGKQGTIAEAGQIVKIGKDLFTVVDEGGGKLVVETKNGKILEIPSDNPTLESIGAKLVKAANVTRESKPKEYSVQVANNTMAIINGEKYSIVRDENGNIVSAQNQRRGVSVSNPEVIAELQNQIADPSLRQQTKVIAQQQSTQVNETVQPERTAGTTTAAQPQPTSTEMAGQAIPEGGQTEGLVQPGTEAAASPVGAPVSGVTTEAAPVTGTEAAATPVETAPVTEAAPTTAAPEAAPTLPSFEEYDSNFKGEGLKKGQRMQNKENFSSTYGAEVYEGMRKINDNFTRITDALIKDNRLDKKC